MIEPASNSPDSQERDIPRLGCETRTTHEGISWLNQYRSDESDALPSAAMLAPSVQRESEDNL